MKANDIKVVTTEFDYNMLPVYVDAIVDGAYDSDGKYHEYLYDYSIASFILKLFTNYNGEYDFDEVMGIFHSEEEWIRIYSECLNCYYAICKYSKKEIDERNKPMATVNDLIKDVSAFVNELTDVLNTFKDEKLKDFIENLDVDAVNKFSKLLGG